MRGLSCKQLFCGYFSGKRGKEEGIFSFWYTHTYVQTHSSLSFSSLIIISVCSSSESCKKGKENPKADVCVRMHHRQHIGTSKGRKQKKPPLPFQAFYRTKERSVRCFVHPIPRWIRRWWLGRLIGLLMLVEFVVKFQGHKSIAI